MDEWFKWLKKHKVLVLVIAIAIVLGVPILIHICFKIPAPCEGMVHEWEAGDILSFYGNVLGFLGTVALSTLALYQNNEIKTEVDKREKLLMKMEREKNEPILDCKFDGYAGNYQNLRFLLENVSDNLVSDLVINNFIVLKCNGEFLAKSKRVFFNFNKIKGGEKKSFEFMNEAFSGENLKLQFIVECTDKFKNSIKYQAILNIKETSTLSKNMEFFKI